MSLEKPRQYKWPLLAALAAATYGSVAVAQVTPADVRDLVGARGPGGESELAARGYVNVAGQGGAAYWWNEQRGVCLRVGVREGRFDTLVAALASECRQGSSGGIAPPEFGYAPNGRDYREHLALVCYGEGHKLATEPQAGYQWDNDKKKYVPRSGYTTTMQDYDTSVTVEIDGDRGRIKPARNMLPPLRSGSDDGWYDISSLAVSRDMIRGEFRLNGLNKPKITIDRRAGRIVLDGLTQFSGDCTPLDGDRRF